MSATLPESTHAPGAAAVNIAAHLHTMAERYPHKRAVVVPVGRDPSGRVTYAHLTFAQLVRETDRYAHGLERAGIGRGVRTILMVRPGLDFFTLTFALFKVGAVLVLIDPGMGRRQLIRCLAEIEAEAFIGIPLAQVARVLFRSAFRTVKTVVTVGRRMGWGGLSLGDVRMDPWKPYAPAETAADETAAILFTSGSTGPAKGVVYAHGMFDAQVRYLHSHYGYSPEEIDLATFPLFALFDAALGMTAVIPDMDPTRPAEANPVKIIEAIENQGISHMFGSPALLDRLSRYAAKRQIKLASLKRVMTAGAPVSPAVLERMRTILDESADIYTPYGATESLPVASIESRTILAETAVETAAGKGICVGPPLAGMEARIIAIDEEPIERMADATALPMGDIGEICVRGPVVTQEYFRRADATQLAKMRDGETIWHRMGDVGYLDARGRVWFCGRKAHRVRTPAGTLFTIPCEAIFNQHPKVLRTALVGVGPAGAQQPVLCVETETGVPASAHGAIEQDLREYGAAHALTAGIDRFLFHPAFPVDVRHNAKIFREKLAVWAAERVG